MLLGVCLVLSHLRLFTDGADRQEAVGQARPHPHARTMEEQAARLSC